MCLHATTQAPKTHCFTTNCASRPQPRRQEHNVVRQILPPGPHPAQKTQYFTTQKGTRAFAGEYLRM